MHSPKVAPSSENSGESLTSLQKLKAKVIYHIYESEEKVWRNILDRTEYLFMMESILAAGMVGTLVTLGMNLTCPSWKNVLSTVTGAVAWRFISEPFRNDALNTDFFSEEVENLVETIEKIEP